jgi:hypothetical protein
MYLAGDGGKCGFPPCLPFEGPFALDIFIRGDNRGVVKNDDLSGNI